MNELVAGTLIDNRYVVEAPIGAGGMAEVYRVRHVHLETQHALKLLTMGGRSLQRRLMQEGRVQATLNHINIVSVTDVVMMDNQPGLVMEYVQGPPLDELLDSRSLSLSQVDAVVAGILDGVKAAHDLQLIHRDLKPANVMVSIGQGSPVMKVADFGLVKMVADESEGFASKTRSGMAMGTPSYMAPEQVRDAKTVDHRADIWSLGAIMYELVAGRRPFEGEDILELMVRVAGNERSHIAEVCPELPERMVKAIEGAMHHDRNTRIQSVADLKAIWFDGAQIPGPEVWDEDTLQVARKLGSGGEDAGSFLRRSFKSRAPGLGRPIGGTAVPFSGDNRTANTSPTAVPFEGTQATAVPNIGGAQQTVPQPRPQTSQTFVLDDEQAPEVDALNEEATGSLAPIQAPNITLGPQSSFDTLLPKDADLTTPSSDELAGSGKALATIGLVGVLTAVAVVAVVGVGAVWYLNGPTEHTVPGTEANAVAVEPDTTPANPPPSEAGTDEAPTNVPGEARPSGEGTDEPGAFEPAATNDEPTPAPEPTAQDTPSITEGEAASGTADESDESDETERVNTEEPAAEVAAVVPPTVTIKSDVTVDLRNTQGRAIATDQLTPGAYEIVVFWEPRVPTVVKTIQLEPGSLWEIQCSASRKICRTSLR